MKYSYSVSIDVPTVKLTWLIIALVASWCAISIFMIFDGTLDPDRTVLWGLALILCLWVPLRFYISLRIYRGLWLAALAMELSRLGVPSLFYTPIVIVSVLLMWYETFKVLQDPLFNERS